VWAGGKKMTRKDTILIAVVINAGLLAILFTTAVIYDTDKGIEQTEFVAPVTDDRMINTASSSNLIAAAGSTGDEVDNVLKYYSQPSSQRVVMEVQSEAYIPEPIAVQANEVDDEDLGAESDLSGQERFIEVKVKKGDMLEKIARANKTTVGAIKNVNHLQHERLSIGQVLKIPVKQESSAIANATLIKKQEIKQEAKQEQRKGIEATEVVYYVIKSGDNPWKIAKQFNVKYDEILRLNQLDEDKARNLKIGDRIRVK
jgi:LysM repeat protein